LQLRTAYILIHFTANGKEKSKNDSGRKNEKPVLGKNKRRQIQKQ